MHCRSRVIALLLATLAGCSAGSSAAGNPTPTVTPTRLATTTPGSPSATPHAAAPACPSSYAAPDPNRPVVRLAFHVHRDRGLVNGVERIRFTPDRPVGSVVWRLWPNSPRPAAAGGRMRVTTLSGDHGLRTFSVHKSGTLIRAPLAARVPGGTQLQATLHFTFHLPTGADDRYGNRPEVAWWGSGFPLLAWIRGEGWATEPPTALFAEASTSEDFRLGDLAVTADGRDTVLATGVRQGTPAAAGGGRRTWHFVASAVRDVAVAVGRFRMASTTGPGHHRIRVGVTRGMTDNASVIAGVMRSAMADHAARFGPFPYRRLVVAVVPDVRGGIEYPGAIFLGHHQLDATPSHEVAHEWFYGLVGDDQARDPWLDESFATYVEALDRGTGSSYRNIPIPPDGEGRLGAPMTYWANHPNSYFRSVYIQGAVALLRARDAVGHRRFDRAIRCYVRREAHRIATPEVLRRALADLATAQRILGDAGAWSH